VTQLCRLCCVESSESVYNNTEEEEQSDIMNLVIWLLLCSLCVARSDFENMWAEFKDEATDDWKSVQKEVKSDWNSLKDGLSEVWNKEKEDKDSGEEKDTKSSESKESSEQLKSDNNIKESKEDKTDDDINRCSDLCMLYASQAEQLDESTRQKLCTKGCKTLFDEFHTLQGQFKTPPEYLLGTAVDKCMQGCSGEHNSAKESLCASGCNNMRLLQKRQLDKVNKEEVREREDIGEKENIEPKKEIKTEVSDNKKEEESLKTDHKESDLVIKNDKESQDIINKAVEDIINNPSMEENQVPHHWTYVLWRPKMTLDEDPFQSYVRMVNMINTMLDSANIDEDQGRKNPGWRDDRMQLNFPSLSSSRNAAALRDGEEGDFYDKVSESLESIKDKVEATFADPGFRDDMYYVLIGLCGFLLLTTAFNSIFHKKEDRDNDEDHYYLHGAASKAKLPSYEDCLKADKELLVDMAGQAEELPAKAKLSPFVVDTETKEEVTVPEIKKEDDMAQGDRENIV